MEVDRTDIRGVFRSLSGALNSPSSVWLADSAPLEQNMPGPVSEPRTLFDKIWDDHVMYVTFGSSEGSMLIPICLLAIYRMTGSP